MRIPWIQEWNEHRRLRHEERKQERMVRRLADGYENFSKGFAKSFGVPFELAAVMAIQPRMKELVRDALPDILNALAEGNPGVDGGEYDGTLVASLDRQHGAFWGAAPAGEGPDRSTAAFHAFLSYDTEEEKYTINMLEGVAQVVGYAQRHIAGGTFESTDENHKNWWCWLEWTQSTNSWSLESSNSQPTMAGDLNAPLWKFTWAADGAGELVQYIEGAILLVWTVNALDVDSAV